MLETQRSILRQLPSVDVLAQRCVEANGVGRLSRQLLLEAVREVLERKRQQILAADTPEALSTIEVGPEALVAEVAAWLARAHEPHFQRVINATGVVLHTNLGRALLSRAAVENVAELASHYSNLEFDLGRGERGSRYVAVVGLLRRLTGAEDALVVNNNAAAVLLALQALSAGREVIVSRGELIEIGGSFRIPDIMRSSGAILHEVGTTNKTHLADYQEAITDRTALLLKVHTSNYRILGFTEAVPRRALVELGAASHLPVMEDLGSGNLIDLGRYGLDQEPTVSEVIRAGVDIVTFSGDKLLGGPQAGLIVGKKRYVEILKRHPLNRAVRIDKMTLAALEATLRHYLDPDAAVREIPTLRMLTAPLAQVNRRAQRLLRQLKGMLPAGWSVSVQTDAAEVGAGALPLAKIPTRVLAVRSANASAAELERRFRQQRPAVLGRIQQNTLLLDMRTVQDQELADIVQAFQRVSAQDMA
ncbi:MAG TPA: L-seryl-tRNA(Sec) selenium transferase [Alphaproteobacteria bacterium]|nr:L-seryl-tRNA(Sec) selenium transferase [Alphaproteobacteria bacterium]